jgi:hypothetical protein
MGKLLKQIEATPVNKGGLQSSIEKAIAKMDKDDKEDLLCALRNPTISPTVIAQVLNDNGFAVGRSAINRWRDKEGI